MKYCWAKPGIQDGVQDGRRNIADLVSLLLSVTNHHIVPLYLGIGGEESNYDVILPFLVESHMIGLRSR